MQRFYVDEGRVLADRQDMRVVSSLINWSE